MPRNNSKYLLPIVEIIIALIIFIGTAVITMQLFFLAKFLGVKTEDRERAMLEAQNIAETIASAYYTDELTAFTGTGSTVVYFDKNWIQNGTDHEYEIRIDSTLHDNTEHSILYDFTINVYKFTPYPYIDDKYKELSYDEKPLIDEINLSKFVLER